MCTRAACQAATAPAASPGRPTGRKPQPAVVCVCCWCLVGTGGHGCQPRPVGSVSTPARKGTGSQASQARCSCSGKGSGHVPSLHALAFSGRPAMHPLLPSPATGLTLSFPSVRPLTCFSSKLVRALRHMLGCSSGRPAGLCQTCICLPPSFAASPHLSSASSRCPCSLAGHSLTCWFSCAALSPHRCITRRLTLIHEREGLPSFPSRSPGARSCGQPTNREFGLGGWAS